MCIQPSDAAVCPARKGIQIRRNPVIPLESVPHEAIREYADRVERIRSRGGGRTRGLPSLVQAHSESKVAVRTAKRPDVYEFVAMVVRVVGFATSLLRGHLNRQRQRSQ